MKIKRLIVLVVLVAMLVAPIIGLSAPEGFTVIKKDVISVDAMLIQLRLIDLNYLAYRPTGKFGNISAYATKQFQLNNGLEADGQVGPVVYDTLFGDGLVRSKYHNDIIMYGDSDDTITHLGDGISWSIIDAAFPVGTEATIQDCHTNISYTIKRIGGDGHAHIEPVTQRDTNAFYDMFTKDKVEVEYLQNGRLTYEKRPCVITIGENSYAASLFGYVHGSDPEFVPPADDPEAEAPDDNGMDGYLCLFFQGSTTDVLNLTDAEHEANVKEASH